MRGLKRAFFVVSVAVLALGAAPAASADGVIALNDVIVDPPNPWYPVCVVLHIVLDSTNPTCAPMP